MAAMRMFLISSLCLAALVSAMPQIEHGRPKISLKKLVPIPRAPVLDEVKAHMVVENKNVAHAVRTSTTSEEEAAKLFKEQAENAKYAFETSVDDGIMGHAHSRTEVRDGLNVVGMYSFSDGFYKRTINYEADDKGYRVTKEEVEPIGDGPVIDEKGEAIVRSSLGAEYRITLDDYQKKDVE